MMKKQINRHHFFFIGLILIVVVSCQRSQFATTSRNYNNGRVTYTNSYHYENRKGFNIKSFRTQLKPEDKHALVDGGLKNTIDPEIKKIVSISEIHGEHLSASIEPMVSIVNDHHLNSANNHPYSANNHTRFSSGLSSPDSISKNNETKTRLKELQTPGTRKIEKHGLTGFILSILGLFPIVGLPLAILGLVFGLKSLRKIHQNPTLYKGKGFAITSIILGVLGIIISGVLIGMFISLSIWGASGGAL
jgi:hypothetical protein